MGQTTNCPSTDHVLHDHSFKGDKPSEFKHVPDLVTYRIHIYSQTTKIWAKVH